MSLEATMVLLDNSQYSLNGDYFPTRWEAQKDAVGLISTQKYNAHPESMVGVGLLCGQQSLLTAPTDEQTKIMASIHAIPLSGTISLIQNMSIAQLALKHRLNKAQRQRIIVFVASPIEESEQALIQLAKKLKKNEVAVDVINVGVKSNLPKIEAFVNAVNKEENSRFLDIPTGLNSIGDHLVGSPILGGQQNVFEDPNMDPEIAEAIRLSLEEEKQRVEREKGQSNANKDTNQPTESNKMEIEEEMNEEELLEKAKQLSMQEAEQVKDALEDKQFVDDLLKSIPGADPNSEEVQKALKDLNKKKDDKK